MSAGDSLDKAAFRLLTLLREDGAFGVISELDESTLVVFAPRGGVTIARGAFPLAVAQDAERRDLAQWRLQNGRRALSLGDAGRSLLARREAPPAASPYLAQHKPLATRAPAPGETKTLIDEGESPLAWLARRKDKSGKPFLSPAQIEAGERLRRDIEQAQILQRVTANWEAEASSSRRPGAMSVSDVALDARRRLQKAHAAVGGDLAGLLTDVCGYLKGLELVESERGWPARSGKVVLRIALERLAAHYGLGDEARGRARAPLSHWGAPDYRPAIE